MYRSNPLAQRSSISVDRLYTLTREISAMQTLPSADGGVHLSPVSKLPRGAEIAACGPGFDSQTMKVLYEGTFYYVFSSDLDEKELARAAAG